MTQRLASASLYAPLPQLSCGCVSRGWSHGGGDQGSPRGAHSKCTSSVGPWPPRAGFLEPGSQGGMRSGPAPSASGLTAGTWLRGVTQVSAWVEGTPAGRVEEEEGERLLQPEVREHE